MSKQVQDAYIVAATRTPVGKVRGALKNVRPDDMLAHVIRNVMACAPGLDPALIGDVVVGCAMPEAEQGMNIARNWLRQDQAGAQTWIQASSLPDQTKQRLLKSIETEN